MRINYYRFFFIPSQLNSRQKRRKSCETSPISLNPTYNNKLDGDEGRRMGVDLAEVEGGVSEPRPLDDQLPVVGRQVGEGVARVRAEDQPVSGEQVHGVACPLDPGHLQKEYLVLHTECLILGLICCFTTA